MSCGCKENKENTGKCNCKLEGRGEANVFMLDEETRVVDVPHDPIVVSTDNTVSIDVSTESYEDGTRPVYDLSVQCCDSKVSVCVGDTNPGVLRDKIDVSGALTIDVDCGDKITIGLDESKLPIQPEFDEKVARQNGCQEGYLDDLIGLTDEFQRVDSTNPLTAGPITDNCSKRYIGRKCSDADKCKPWRKQIGKLRLDTNVVRQQTAGAPGTGVEKFWLFYSGTTPTLGGVSTDDVSANFDEEITVGGITYVDSGIRICRDGIYRVSYSGSLEVTAGINGIRTLLYAKDPTGGGGKFVLESRYSPPSDAPLAGTTRPPYNLVTTAGGASGLNRGFDFLERAPFAATDIYKFRAGTIIYFGVKVSSITQDPSYPLGNPAEFAILGSNSIGATASGDIGMQFSVESIDDPCSAIEYENCEVCN